MAERLTQLARSAYTVFRNLRGTPSRTDTSSSQTGGFHQVGSLLGGSSTHLSVPTTMTSFSHPQSIASMSTTMTTPQQLQGQQLQGQQLQGQQLQGQALQGQQLQGQAIQGQQLQQQHSPPYTFGHSPGVASARPSALPFGVPMRQFHPQSATIMPGNFAALPPQDAGGMNMSSYIIPVIYPNQQWPAGPLSFAPGTNPFPNQAAQFPQDIFGPSGSDADFNGLPQ